MDEQLLRDFLAEAEELVEALFGDIRTLRGRRQDGRARRELVARIFRHVHTVKGSASAAGLDEVGRLAHELETLLDGVRAGAVAVDDDMLDAAEAAVEAASRLLACAARGEPTLSPPRAVVERLRHLSTRHAPKSPDAARLPGGTSAAHAHDPHGATDGAALPDDVAASLADDERARLDEAVAEGARVYCLTVDLALENFDERFRELCGALAEAGEVVSSQPGIPEDPSAGVNFRVVYATTEDYAQVVSRVAPFGAALIGAVDASGPQADETHAGTREHQPESGEQRQSAEPPEGQPAEESPAAPTLSSLTMLVRVPLEELDDLISSTHELFTDALAALDLALGGLPAGATRGELEIQSPRLRRRFVDLEERLIELRMVPVRTTLERAARVGAAAARAAGREVDFETAGGEVRLDKSLAEAVSDPLLHLLRNAVDHGIEPAGERLARGKPARGRVRLEAEASGSRVLLRVADDGRGIDPERVTRAARERGLLRPGERLTERQALRLIFRPGFTTAAELSSVSGRGVGLDVVERAVEDAGGELRVWSRAGEGTTFELRLPTTLALVPALVVGACAQRYCVDAGHVSEVGFAAREDVEEDGAGGRTVAWRGERLPLVGLCELLGRAGASGGSAERLAVVVSHVAGRGTKSEESAAPRRVAVVVDEWDGHREVLVRGLGRHATRWRGVSGATELPDGSVALLLDVPRLLEMHEAPEK